MLHFEFTEMKAVLIWPTPNDIITTYNSLFANWVLQSDKEKILIAGPQFILVHGWYKGIWC